MLPNFQCHFSSLFNLAFPRDLTKEGYKGLHCCLLQKQHILQQKLRTVTSIYTLDTDPSIFILEEDLKDYEDESEQDNSSPELSEDEL